jgi:hypothetical protein
MLWILLRVDVLKWVCLLFCFPFFSFCLLVSDGFFFHFRFDSEKQGRRIKFDYRGVEKEPCFSTRETFQRGI